MGTVPQLTLECDLVIWVEVDDKSNGKACFFSLILFFSGMKKEVIIEITASLSSVLVCIRMNAVLSDPRL